MTETDRLDKGDGSGNDIEDLGKRLEAMIQRDATPMEIAGFFRNSVLPSLERTLDELDLATPAVPTIGLCQQSVRGIRMAAAGCLNRFNLLTIKNFPILVNGLFRNEVYTSLISPDVSYNISQLHTWLDINTDGHSTIKVIEGVKAIRDGKRDDPDFLLDDEAMELLRALLFMANHIGVKEKDFRDFGIGIFTDLKKFVAEFEERKGRESKV